MGAIQAMVVLASVLITPGSSLRPSFAGFRPIGYPELVNKTTTPSGLQDKFGEGTTQRLPFEAQGDQELVDRLSKLPVDQQPFWFINWQAVEANRDKPQTYPLKPNPFLEDNLQNSAPQNQNPTFVNSNPGFVNPNPGVVNRNPDIVNPSPSFVNPSSGFPNPNPAFVNSNPSVVNSNPGIVNSNSGFPSANPNLINTNPNRATANPSNTGNSNSGIQNPNRKGQGTFNTKNSSVDNRYGTEGTSTTGINSSNSNTAIENNTNAPKPLSISDDVKQLANSGITSTPEKKATAKPNEENEFEDVEVKKNVKKL